MVAKRNVLKLFRNPWYESGECDAGAEADLVHVRGNGRAAASRCSPFLEAISFHYHAILKRWFEETVGSLIFSHCKNVCAFVCCWACVHTNHCLVVTSSDNGLSSGRINSAYYIKNQSKRGILRQLLHSHGIPSCQNNWFIMLGVALGHTF